MKLLTFLITPAFALPSAFAAAKPNVVIISGASGRAAGAQAFAGWAAEDLEGWASS